MHDAGGVVPAGWNVITPQQLGVPPQFWDGNYFTNNGASAIVLQQGNAWIVSFRGTDGSNDILSYPELPAYIARWPAQDGRDWKRNHYID